MNWPAYVHYSITEKGAVYARTFAKAYMHDSKCLYGTYMHTMHLRTSLVVDGSTWNKV